MARRSRAAKSRTAKSRRASKSAPATGPVTLAQARALAAAKTPVARGAKRALAAAPPSPATVGLERRNLRKKQELERKQRVKDYKATLSIMKKRGVKGLGPKRPTGGRALKQAPKPLQIFAEGDSWFDYPPFDRPQPVRRRRIVPRLEKRLGVPILNLAKAGDEVRYMLGVKERKLLIQQLTNGCPAGGPWDAMLFSGGGNDIVDNPMALWVRDFNAGMPPAALIHQARFDAALALVRAGYEDLIALRDALSPQTHLFFHGYDFAIPDGRGVCFLGPWLKPTFDLRGFPSQASAVRGDEGDADAVRRDARLARRSPTVTFINGQGTLTPQTSSWHNELHPSKAGFNAFAALFHQKLKAVFPTRVL